MYPIGKVWLNVCSQADDGKSNAGDMQGRSQCREENNEKDMHLDIYIYIYGTPCAHEKGRLSRGGTIYVKIQHGLLPFTNIKALSLIAQQTKRRVCTTELDFSW